MKLTGAKTLLTIALLLVIPSAASAVDFGVYGAFYDTDELDEASASGLLSPSRSVRTSTLTSPCPTSKTSRTISRIEKIAPDLGLNQFQTEEMQRTWIARSEMDAERGRLWEAGEIDSQQAFIGTHRLNDLKRIVIGLTLSC